MHLDTEKAIVESPLTVWLRDLMRGPLRSHGDYFERLSGTIESSAPVCGSCG